MCGSCVLYYGWTVWNGCWCYCMVSPTVKVSCLSHSFMYCHFKKIWLLFHPRVAIVQGWENRAWKKSHLVTSRTNRFSCSTSNFLCTFTQGLLGKLSVIKLATIRQASNGPRRANMWAALECKYFWSPGLKFQELLADCLLQAPTCRIPTNKQIGLP